METERIRAPRLTFDSLIEIIRSYLKAGGDKTEVTDAEVANKASSDMHPVSVSKNTEFFVSLGLIRGKRERFRLTPVGIKLARSLDEQSEEARSILADAIKNKPLVSQTLAYVTTDIAEEALKKKIIENTDLRILKSNKAAPAGAVIEMLTYAGLLSKYFDPRTRKPMISLGGKTTNRTASVPISVAVNVSGDIDREQLKSIIHAIREVLAEE